MPRQRRDASAARAREAGDGSRSRMASMLSSLRESRVVTVGLASDGSIRGGAGGPYVERGVEASSVWIASLFFAGESAGDNKPAIHTYLIEPHQRK